MNIRYPDYNKKDLSCKKHEKRVVTYDTFLYLWSSKGQKEHKEKIFKLVKFLKDTKIFLNEYKFLYEYFNFFAEIDRDFLFYYCFKDDRRVAISFLHSLRGLRERFKKELGLVMKTRKKYNKITKRKLTQAKFKVIKTIKEI